MKRRYFVALALVAIVLAMAGPALAQKATGGLQGSVVDENDQVLPGVTVTVTAPEMMGERLVITDSDGRFRFSLLPPGTYKAVFSLVGFQGVEQEAIKIGIESVVTLEVTLHSAFADEMVVTGGTPLVDVTSTTMGNTFDREVMESLPTGRTFNDLAFLATGAVDGGGLADPDQIGNTPSIMGSAANENRYVVDTLETTDTAFGLAGTVIPLSFLQEVQVKTGGYEAEFGGSVGGLINMITKSGGNEFAGDVFGYFTNGDLWSEAEIPAGRGDTRVMDQEWDAGFSLGGSFVRDRVWFYAGYNPYSQDQQILKDIYDLEDDYVSQNDFTRSTKRQQFVAKLTWQPAMAHSVVASVIGDPTEQENSFYSTFYVPGPEGVPTNQFNDTRKLGGINYSLNWNVVLKDSLVIEAGAGHHSSKDEFGPKIDYPNYQDSTPNGRFTNGIGGGSFFGGPGFQNIVDDRTRDQARATMTWFLGDAHEVKAGAQWSDNTYDINYQMVGGGGDVCAHALSRSIENPWWEGLYGAVWINPTTGEAEELAYDCDSDGNGTMDGIYMAPRAGDRWRLRRTYYYNRNFKSDSEGKTEQFSVFLQDSWKVADNFTLSLGVRAERSKATGDISGTVANAQLDFGFSDMIAPRVGFIWDFANNGRSRVFGHYGRFYESIPLNINVRAMGNEVYDFWYYQYPSNPEVPSAENPGTLFYWLQSGASRMDPNIKPPYMEEVVFGGDYEVFKDVAVGVKGIYRSLPMAIEDISVDGGASYFITNPGGTFTYNPGPPQGGELDEPVTFPEPARFYRGVELSVQKRQSNNWQGFASLLWSRLEGNYEGLYSRDNAQLDPNITSKFDLPDLLVGARGMLPNDRKYQFKAYGSYLFDFGLTTGLSFQYFTGTPVNKMGAHSTYGDDERFVVPRGEGGRTPTLYTFDLHTAYPVKIGDYTLEILVDVFNLLDQQRAVELDQRWSTMDEYEAEGLSVAEQRTESNWGQPLVYYPPRNIRLGLRFSF